MLLLSYSLLHNHSILKLYNKHYIKQYIKLHIKHNMLKNGNLLDNLDLADTTPIFKKKNPLHKVNYRRASVLSSIYLVFEKLMQKPIIGYISNYLSLSLCEYRKGSSSQQALLSLTENWKKVLDKIGFGGAVLMYLSKAFIATKHDLLIGKRYVYGVNKDSLNFLHSYLSTRWHRIKSKINNLVHGKRWFKEHR